MGKFIPISALCLLVAAFLTPTAAATETDPAAAPAAADSTGIMNLARMSVWNPDQTDQDAPFVSLLPDIAYEAPPFNELNLREFVGLDIDVTLHGDVWAYSVWNNNVNHTDGHAHFVETVLRAAADFQYGDAFGGQFRAVGTDVHSRPDGRTMPRRTDFDARVDLANVSFTGSVARLESTLTVGLQELSYGDGLLIYDGYSEKRAVWTNPIRSFPAIRWSTRIEKDYTLDIFSALVHDDYLNYEAYIGDGARVETGGMVSGANLNAKTDTVGEIDIGVFYKYDDAADNDPGGQDTSSNTYAVSVRDSLEIHRFTLTGELVKQWGRTKVAMNSLTDERHSRSALGGQATARYDFTADEDSPWLLGRWAQFQGDRSSTSGTESFDPFFGGYYDWGTWVLGDITSFFYPNTNKRVIMFESGVVPLPKTQLRAIYYDISLDQKMPYSGSPQWSNEVNLIFDYYPCPYAFMGVMLGAAFPEGAAERFYGDDDTQTQVAVWAGLTF